MNTFAYLLIASGLVIIGYASRRRRLSDLPKDMADLSVGMVTFDSEMISEVLNRKGEVVNVGEAFDESGGDWTQKAAVAGPALAATGTGGSGKTVADLVALGRSLRAKGYIVAENKALGDNPRPGGHLATGYHYKFDNSGAIDVNWPNAAQEARMFDALVPVIRAQGFHVLWRVKGHYNHMHVDISRRDI